MDRRARDRRAVRTPPTARGAGLQRRRGATLALGIGANGAIFALAAVAAQTISTFLFGVEPLDRVTFAVATSVLAVTAAVAVPALRAARVDPVVACRAA